MNLAMHRDCRKRLLGAGVGFLIVGFLTPFPTEPGIVLLFVRWAMGETPAC